jgi:putative transposase
MKRTPRPVLRALEALAQSPINTSALAVAEGQDFAHDTLYRALNQPRALCFERSLELCKAMGGLDRGYLLLDDVLIRQAGPAEGPGRLHGGLGVRAVPGGAGLDGGETADSPGLPALLRREQAGPAGVGQGGGPSEGVLFDAWYAAKWLHAHGGSFVTRRRSNRVLEGVQRRRHGGTRWVKAGKGRSTGFGEPSRRFSGGFSGNWGGRGIGTGGGPGGWPIWPWGGWPVGASSGSGRGWSWVSTDADGGSSQVS